MKQLSFLLLFFFSVSIFSQSNNSISPKYIIVKSNFDFLKKEDRYKTSSFTKFLFNKADVFLCQGEKWKKFAVNSLNINPNHTRIISNWSATNLLFL